MYYNVIYIYNYMYYNVIYIYIYIYIILKIPIIEAEVLNGSATG